MSRERKTDHISRRIAVDAVDKPLTIYLAGGFQSDWQDRIKKAAQQFRYFDPRSHGLENRGQYAMWDLEAIRRSDWIFAYLEANKPWRICAAEVFYRRILKGTE